MPSFCGALRLGLVLALCLGLMPTEASAATLEPIPSDNLMEHAYGTYGSTVQSYLYEDEERGQLVRVEYVDGSIIVEFYDMNFVLQSQKILDCALPKWGGFFAGDEYNFVILGQDNPQERDDVEVIRFIKYDKDWNMLEYAGYYGLNTVSPFQFGSLRCAEDATHLYVHTCHRMFRTADGLNHQANMTFAIRRTDLSIEDTSGVFLGLVNQNFYFYVSHSFNQYILVDQEGRIVTYDHGDAAPRSAVLQRGTSDVNIQEFAGAWGDNITDASLGGLEETSAGYITAYDYQGERYLSFTPKNDFSEQGTRIIPLSVSDASLFGTPMLASTGLDGGYVFWYESEEEETTWYGHTVIEETFTLYCAPYNSRGEVGDAVKIEAQLSDCQPICMDGKLIWYVTDNSGPVFYVLENGEISSCSATGDNTASADSARFVDVAANDYYYDAVAWAVEQEITAGTGAGTTFYPDQTCSVAEIITFLWRAYGCPAPSPYVTVNPFVDVSKGDYYYQAALWAYGYGIISGHWFNGGDACTRAMAVTYLWKAAGMPLPSKTTEFSDVASGAEYATAVSWAVERGITTGTGDGSSFMPDRTCTRAEIVTLLYRNLG